MSEVREKSKTLPAQTSADCLSPFKDCLSPFKRNSHLISSASCAAAMNTTRLDTSSVSTVVHFLN